MRRRPIWISIPCISDRWERLLDHHHRSQRYSRTYQGQSRYQGEGTPRRRTFGTELRVGPRRPEEHAPREHHEPSLVVATREMGRFRCLRGLPRQGDRAGSARLGNGPDVSPQSLEPRSNSISTSAELTTGYGTIPWHTSGQNAPRMRVRPLAGGRRERAEWHTGSCWKCQRRWPMRRA